MTTGTESRAATAAARPRSGPRATLWLLRGVALVAAVAVGAQPVLAGVFLGGESDAITVHSANATALLLLAMLQTVLAVLYAWPGGGRRWPILVGVVLFQGLGIQTGMGHERVLAIHVPLGVALVLAQLAFTAWLFTRRAWLHRAGRGAA